jgi:hypothetical protein
MGSRNRFEKRNDSFSFTPPAGGNLSTEGRRAARRSAGTRRAISPTSAPETDLTGAPPAPILPPPPSPASVAAVPSGRDTTAPVDPNNTGAKGTSMGYNNIISKIEAQRGVTVRNAFEAENLPGTESYGASFALNSGENQRSFGESMAASQAVDGRIVPKVTINSDEMGRMANMLENERQLTPGEQNFGKNQVNLGIADRSSATSPEARKRASRAFLDAEDSMSGLRAAEDEMGVVHAAGRKFAKNPDAEGGQVEITKDQYRARMGGSSMAQAIKDNPVASAAKSKAGARLAASGAGSQTAATEAPSDKQNPFTIGLKDEFTPIDHQSAMHGARANFNTDVKTPNLLKEGSRVDKKVFGL